MSDNSLPMTSTLVKKSFEVENISVSPFCTKLSQTPSFFLIASVLLLSTKVFVQFLCIELDQMAKICPPITQANSSTFHPKEIMLMKSSFLLKIVLFLP